MVQVFRREDSMYESARVKLRGLKPAVRYALNDLDHPGSPREVTGRTFMESSIELAIADKLGSAVLSYKRLPGR